MSISTDPLCFFSDYLGWTPWSKQVEIALSLREAIEGTGPKRVAVRSGNGVGKTALAARLMLWVACECADSIVITTAPTARQVDQIRIYKKGRNEEYHSPDRADALALAWEAKRLASVFFGVAFITIPYNR